MACKQPRAVLGLEAYRSQAVNRAACGAPRREQTSVRGYGLWWKALLDNWTSIQPE